MADGIACNNSDSSKVVQLATYMQLQVELLISLCRLDADVDQQNKAGSTVLLHLVTAR
jgi:hypothetical protein